MEIRKDSLFDRLAEAEANSSSAAGNIGINRTLLLFYRQSKAKQSRRASNRTTSTKRRPAEPVK
jgi:hypothetical protein